MRSRSEWLFVAFAVVLLGDCMAAPDPKTTSLTAGGYSIMRRGVGTPAVVFESGLGGSKESWVKVYSVIASDHMAFAYDRPGMGKSPGTQRLRDGETIVEDLRTLLRSEGLAPPYVLVGHSAGGLYFQLFARRHPEEVAGLVLVDPTHPTSFEGEGAIEKRGALSNFIVATAMSWPMKAEFAALNETGREVLEAPNMPARIPCVILVAPDMSRSAFAKFDNAKRADFRNLYPNANVRDVQGGHDLPRSNPAVVIDAVNEVIKRLPR